MKKEEDRKWGSNGWCDRSRKNKMEEIMEEKEGKKVKGIISSLDN